MADLDPEDVEQARKKRTVWLMAGGAVSLLLPLLGVVYLHWSASSGAGGPSGRNDVFERRDVTEKRLTPSQTAVPSPLGAATSPLPTQAMTGAGGGSSLDFVKSNQDLAGRQPAPAPAAPAAAPPPLPAPEPAPQAASAKSKTPAKKAKKDFAMPKLQAARGFTKMGGNAGGRAAAPPQGGGGQDIQGMMQNLPPDAANNPQLQQYMKGQGR